MENKTKVVSIRMTEEDYKLLRVGAYTLGLTPSKMLRMLADSTINAVRVQLKTGKINYEDIESILND